jgi:hypothetical protein
VRVSGLKGKSQLVQGQVLVTWTQVDINLLEPENAKHVLLHLESELEPGKNIFENKVKIYM